MRFRSVLIFTAVLILGWSASAPAQQPQGPFKWWQSDKFKAELGLSAEQSARMEEIFDATVPKLRACNGDLEKLERKLAEIVASPDATEAEFLRHNDRVEAARSAMSRERSLMLFRIWRVLTPDQRTKLRDMFDKWEAERRRNSRRDRDR